MIKSKEFIVPDKLKKGDKVAIVSPSSGAAAAFPWVYHQGLNRLKEDFGLEPIEFPTALKDGQYLAENPQARARDINQAFNDKSIKAVIATIGGDDQIKILDYLDKDVIAQNPKMFLGLSDNTNLHLYLWNLGIVSYYGGSVMQQWAQNGKMDTFTVENFHHALFKNETREIMPSETWTDVDFEWSDESLLDKCKPMEPNPGWVWYNFAGKEVTGRLWGGCWEIIAWHMLSEKYLPSPEQLEGTILFIETSEEMPSADNVYRSLVGMGIRGWLSKFSAILVGRPKTQCCEMLPTEGREQYLENQRILIIKALSEYAPKVPAVFGLDFGHTDPQILVPSGGIAMIDGKNHKIFFK